MSDRRSLADVFAALDAERDGRRLRMLALAVSFEDRTEFVFAGEQEGLQKLSRLVLLGGEPIGTLGMDQRGAVEVKPLTEYDGEPWVFDYLHNLTASVLRTLEAAGVAKVERGDH